MEKYLNRRCDDHSIVLILLSILLFWGCAHEHSTVDRDMPTGIQSGDKIAVLINSAPYSESSPDEKMITNCISRGFSKKKVEVSIIPSVQFYSDFFLNLSLPDGSNTLTAIDNILNDSSKKEKIERTGIRYIILVDEARSYESDTLDESGWTLVAGGYGPAGVIVPTYEKEKVTFVSKELHASIFDVSRGCKSGEINSWCSGTYRYYMLFPLVIAWPSGVSLSQACNELGENVAGFIIDDQNAE